MQQKRHTLSLFFTLAVLTLGGCSASPNDSPAPVPPLPFAGRNLTVACPTELTADIVRELGQGWTGKTGASLRVVSYSPERGEAPPADADLWGLEAIQLPHWASQGKLRSLPESFTSRSGKFHWSGLLPIYQEQLLGWAGTAYAVPLLGEAPVCFYRKDLFAQKRHQDAFADQHRRALAEPATWEQFALIAEYFSQALEQGKARPTLPPLPTNDRELDRLYYTIAASYARRALVGEVPDASPHDRSSFHFDFKTGAPRIASDGFLHALMLLQRLQACRPAEARQQPWRSFREGQAVLCLGDARLLGEFQAPGSPVRDRVGVCLVPGHRGWYDQGSGQFRPAEGGGENRVPYLGEGTFLLAVPQSSRQPELAHDLLAALTGRAGSQQIVLEPRWGGGATRLEHLEEDWAGFRLEAAQAFQLRRVLRPTLQPEASNPLIALRVPRERDFRQALVKQLRPTLTARRATTEEGARAMLREVETAWNRLISDRPEEHRRDLAISLGRE